MDDPPPPPQPQVDIALGTSVSGTTITITGDRSQRSIPAGQAATRFSFTLNDTSNQNVQFASLDTKDGITTCPPTGSGNQSTQINGITMNNNVGPRTAGFTDANSNPASNGALNVSYQWNFTCNPGYTVQPFDPIISNGGNNGPI
jgi:hypothetical protein